MTKKQRYHQMLNETGTEERFIYLTVPCSTRSKKIAKKCERLIKESNYAEALRIGDIIAYQVELNEFK